MKRIAVREPIDQVARRVTSPGIRYRPNLKYSTKRWLNVPPIGDELPHGVTDMRGVRRGRMEIVGYWKRVTVYGIDMYAKKKASHKWIGRCDCGIFEVRDGKRFRKKLGSVDMCHDCKHLEYIKQRGKNKNR